MTWTAVSMILYQHYWKWINVTIYFCIDLLPSPSSVAPVIHHTSILSKRSCLYCLVNTDRSSSLSREILFKLCTSDPWLPALPSTCTICTWRRITASAESTVNVYFSLFNFPSSLTQDGCWPTSSSRIDLWPLLSRGSNSLASHLTNTTPDPSGMTGVFTVSAVRQ